MSNGKGPVIVAYGGGVNSTALLIGMFERGLKVDLILFADTGGELPETYCHIRAFNKWLVAHGLPEILWVQKTYKKEPTTLETDCLRNNTLPSIAFGYKACSMKYKRDPQDKFCNNWQPANEVWGRGEKCIKLLGYDFGEPQRATSTEDNKYIYSYPLIEWGWDRDKCVAVCEQNGFYNIPKSACFFCPNNSTGEIIKLKRNHPELLERALKIESNAPVKAIKGLGRGQFAWRDVVSADEAQLKLIPDYEPDMPCGCYDG
jgi:hypothetical protein